MNFNGEGICTSGKSLGIQLVLHEKPEDKYVLTVTMTSLHMCRRNFPVSPRNIPECVGIYKALNGLGSNYFLEYISSTSKKYFIV